MEAAEASAVHAEGFHKRNLSVEKGGSFRYVDRTSNHCSCDVSIWRAEEQQNGASFCRINRQDSVPGIGRAEEKLKLSSPNAALAKKQQETCAGCLPQLPERITLPPKKRTCMNMEINLLQPSAIHAKESLFSSKLAIPASFSSGNTLTVEFDSKNNIQRESVEELSPKKVLVESTGSSSKYMKPSRLLLRRYKLLSEIV